MLTWLANQFVKRIDLETLANQVEVKLAEQLDERLESKLRKHTVKGVLIDSIKNPSRTIYGITGDRIPISGPYYLKEDPTYRCTFRKNDVFPYHQIGAKKIQVTWIFDPPERGRQT